MCPLPDFNLLAEKFDGPGVDAIILMGSYARGTSGLFSDVDLVRFTGKDAAEPAASDGSYIIDGILVTVASVNPQQVEEWFSRPEIAVNVISGIRAARSLLDRLGTFEAVQRRAQAFVWDADMQQKANRWVSRQMVGWIEEVHKGLEGLGRNDVGRLLNARFGCSWGLSRVMGVHKGVLLSGDNAFYDDVGDAVGAGSEWVRLRRIAFGIEDEDGKAPALREQVIAGLRLYIATADQLGDALEPGDALLVKQTVELIKGELGNQSNG